MERLDLVHLADGADHDRSSSARQFDHHDDEPADHVDDHHDDDSAVYEPADDEPPDHERTVDNHHDDDDRTVDEPTDDELREHELGEHEPAEIDNRRQPVNPFQVVATGQIALNRLGWRAPYWTMIRERLLL